jgi:pyruvyltransferase
MALKVFWHKCGVHSGNFGDNLTPLLLDYLDVDFQWASPGEADFIGIGSLCHLIPKGFRGTIWSTGNLHADLVNDWPHARVLGLRGRLTMQRTCSPLPPDICLGDGGLLSHLLTSAEPKRYRLGIIPHYVHAGHTAIVEAAGRHTDVCQIDICGEPRQVLAQIAQCEAILSTSLHGLIVADSLGIPNRQCAVSGKNQPLGGDFKFRDYYSAFGLQAPLPLQLEDYDDLDALLSRIGPFERPGREAIQEQLLDCLLNALGENRRSTWSSLCLPLAERREAISRRLGPAEQQLHAAAPSAAKTSPLSLEEHVEELRADPGQLVQFCLDCLDNLRAHWEHGVYHREIRVANIEIRNRRPVFNQDGWGVVHEASPAIPHRVSDIQQRRIRDLRQLGRVFSELLPKAATPLHAVVELMIESPSGRGLMDVDQLMLLFEAAKSHLPTQAAEQAPGTNASPDPGQNLCLELAEELTRRRRENLELTRRTGELQQELWAAETKLALYELDAALPEGKAVIIVDDARFDLDVLRGRQRVVVRCGEHSGQYCGPPPDGTVAVRQLEHFPAAQMAYIAFTDQCFWWIDHYRELREYLDSGCSPVVRNQRWCVFHRTPPDPSIELQAS